MDSGFCFLEFRSRFRIAQSPKSLGFGSWPLAYGFYVLGFGLWVLDLRFWTLDFALETSGFGIVHL